MKIVYINPPYGENFVRSARWAARSRGRVQRHPEQALIQIAVLREAGHECRFIEGAALNLSREEILQQVEEFDPDIAIIHTTTPSIYNDCEYAGLLKRKGAIKTVLVGAHASAVPENTFDIAGDAVDYIVRGEADYTLRDIAEGKPPKEIQGISFKDKGEVIHNSSRPLLDVNELPFPAWDLIDPRWYHDAGKLYPFITLYTGRGCHGKCTFCRETQVINGSKLRMRSPDKVIAEMEYVLSMFPYLREIMFETDTFTAVPGHVRGVCEKILEKGIHKQVRWSCNVRVDIQPELLPLMKKAGCRMLMIGFEFGTNKQLESVKKETTIETARRFAHQAHSLGFTLHGCFMIGAPGETPESAQKTIDFAKSLPLDTIQISGVVVYPGTEFYEWARDNDFLVPDDWTGWVNESCEQATVLNYPQMSKETIDYYIDKGLREFYLRPRQIMKMLFSIRSAGDILRKFYGIKSFFSYFMQGKKKKNEDSGNCSRT